MLQGGVLLQQNPPSLLPLLLPTLQSVPSELSSPFLPPALHTAVQALGRPLPQLLAASHSAAAVERAAAASAGVAMNGLLGGSYSPEQAAAAAQELVREGFTAIKIKVRRTCREG